MPQTARIKLSSADLSKLDKICTEIKTLTVRTGTKSKGPHPLPTKKLKVTTRKTPCGQGTHTYDKWEMRIHRRILDIAADDRTMKQLMHINIPEEVIIEVALHK